MKTFRFIGMALFAVLMCVNLASCSSSDDDPTEEPEEGGVVVSGKKLAKIVGKSEDRLETYTFSYDEKGRLMEIKETYEYTNGKHFDNSSRYVWGDDAIGIIYDNVSYTCTLKNGLAQGDDDTYNFIYNDSNRIIKFDTDYYTTTAIWDGDKLVFIGNMEGDLDITLKCEKSCKKGYYPFIASMMSCGPEALLMAHPEIAGMRTTQLPTSVTRGKRDIYTYTYEFDKEGYISKIIEKEEDGSINTRTLTWK